MAGTLAAEELFGQLEKEGIVNSNTILRNNQIRKYYQYGPLAKV